METEATGQNCMKNRDTAGEEDSEDVVVDCEGMEDMGLKDNEWTDTGLEDMYSPSVCIHSTNS